MATSSEEKQQPVLTVIRATAWRVDHRQPRSIHNVDNYQQSPATIIIYTTQLFHSYTTHVHSTRHVSLCKSRLEFHILGSFSAQTKNFRQHHRGNTQTRGGAYPGTSGYTVSVWGAHGERRARTYKGGLRTAPRGPGAQPLVRG